MATSPRLSGARFCEEFPEGVQLSSDVCELLSRYGKKKKALAFDDITLEDKPSSFHPNMVELSTFITRNIKLRSGLLSAAMDTVSEFRMALAIAKMGGVAIIHRNLDAEQQCEIINWVRKKIHNDGMIDSPITFTPDQRFSDLQQHMVSCGYSFTSFPIVDDKNTLVGLLTRDEMDFVDLDENPQLGQIMKPRDKIVTARETTGSEEAYEIMRERKVKKLPVVDGNDKLEGMYIWSDVKQDQPKRNTFSIDSEGHYLVGAAIGLGPEDVERAKMLADSGCNLLVLDSSHGACTPAREQIKALREVCPQVDIIAGNIASYESAMYLLEGESKPDALKVGIGPGSICTTRRVTGHGIPQVTAIFEVWRAVRDYGEKTGYYVPIIADGGIKSSGDIVKCLASGASAVMLGSVLAGCEESPGRLVYKDGRKYKTIRGMGSKSAMEERSGSRGRYYSQKQSHKSEFLTRGQAQKLVPEGVEGLVEYKGSVESVVVSLLGGIQAGLAHSGAGNIKDFQSKATVWTQGSAGVVEGNPHDILQL
eukprot:CAMPEP_0174269360 /NCGR_PEP_ID=MMETSP0439-20130205/40757_1 /TAXON_ID=0 /ORGANISM="Stereomyxa ramosa, Strain Chinc5" /LENGTH=535 /DNA_ID=CAMNT_0015358095 /DNA_START=46 /DNA_END=1653 /DNA_ORIENTATION=+